MEKRSKEKIITMNIYTDGSLKKIGTTTFGGWAFIATRDGNSINESGGSETNTTNQRMELKAICEALEFASTHREPNERIVIHSDSAYAINCYLNEWYVNWQNNGWINSKKEPVANQDLWYKIVPYFDNFWYSFVKVEGHAGNFWNERVDELAQAQAAALKQYGVNLNG